MEVVISSARKSILYLGRPEVSLDNIRNAVVKTLGPQVTPVFVLAKDGPDASLKVSNQKFDIVILDPKSSRLEESGFVKNYRTNQSTQNADLIVMAPSKDWKVPEEYDMVDQVLDSPCTDETLALALCKALSKSMSSKGSASHTFAVDVRVLNALIKSTCFVCNQYGAENIQLKKPEAKTLDTAWKGDVAASIAIRSRVFQGALLISFDTSLYLKLVSGMLGEDIKVLDPSMADAIGEICNVIFGNAKPDFTDYDISLSLPVILQKGQLPTSPPGSAEIRIDGETPHGLLSIQVTAFAMPNH